MTKFLSIKILNKNDAIRLKLNQYPNYHRSVKVCEIRKIEGKKCLLVRCGSRIYNVSSNKDIYFNL